ncbi:unnamed protein product [Medioppia subpectinata]|uniref:YTH domain-containing protein n=1 Tax=Medioppia subpectinata TaxID=1979941 RepID=A0A7R9KKS6_9ACAR|nr:unnamed protein product [Medioppia subpectinata]CAG2104171.1 unnamed protein product [Medioppia subpectinata]
MNAKMKDDHDFDSWRSGAQTHYGSTLQQNHSSSDPYHLSYHYPTAAMFPYSDSMSSSQPWSNGADAVAFLGQYQPDQHQTAPQQPQGHYTMEAMFGSQTSYPFSTMTNNMAANIPSTPFNAFFPSNNDPFWGANSKQSRSQAPPYGRQHDNNDYSYHSADAYHDVKQMESGIAGNHSDRCKQSCHVSLSQGLTLDHIKTSQQDFKSASFDKKFGDSAVGSAPKKTTWASIASQPAKPQPKSLKSKMSSSVLTGSTSKHLPPTTSMEAIGTWEAKNGAMKSVAPPPQPRSAPPPAAPAPPPPQQPSWNRRELAPPSRSTASAPTVVSALESVLANHPVLDKLKVENNYNPKDFDLNPRNARFFIIKSYSEDDIHRSIKYSIWCSTEHGNKRLDNAFKAHENKGPIYLLYSVNGSGHFCGMAQMMSSVDYASSSSVWAQDKWKGQFRVKWVYVKDVPNAQLRHIRLENNENKPVTNSRDTQEVPFEKGKQVIKIMHHFRHTTSIFDDFLHYEKRQEEEGQRRDPSPPPPPPTGHKRQQHQQQQQWK